MGLSIVECGNLAEYLSRTAAEETTNDYLYLNKFNNSMIFSDNGTRALLSDPITAPYPAIYIKAVASGTGTGESAENACTLDTAKLITPKNAHAKWSFVGKDFSADGFDIEGYSDLTLTFDSSFDGKIASIVDSKVTINDSVAVDSITDSTVTGTGTVTLTVNNIDRSIVSAHTIDTNYHGSHVLTIANNSSVLASFLASRVLTISNNSHVIASESYAHAITADRNSHVVIGNLATNTTDSTALTASLGSTITYILDKNGDAAKITKTETLLGKVITVAQEDTSHVVEYIASALTEEKPEES